MPTAREAKPYEGGDGLGAGGKFRKKPYRRTHTTPYDRPPTALRNPNSNSSWLSKFVDPAQRLIASGAQKIFSSFFRKRLPPPISPAAPSTSQQPPAPNSASQELNLEERKKHEKSVVTDEGDKQERGIGQIKCQTSSDGSYFTEIEQLLKQKRFTRSEIDSLTALVRSRTVETSAGNEVKMQADNSLRTDFFHEREEKLPENTALENGVQNHPVPCQITGSVNLDDDVGSPASLAKAYMASKPSMASPTSIALRNQSRLKDFSSLNYQSTLADSPSMSVVPWLSRPVGNVENVLTNARYQGRSAMYKMDRTPYFRIQPSSSLKGVGLKHDAYTGTSASREGAQKRRRSFLENDIGSVGPMRRIRRRPYLLSSRGLSPQASGSALSMSGTRSGSDVSHSPLKQPIDTKMSAEKMDDTNSIPSTSVPPPSRKSSEMALKILQHVDKMVLSKDKISGFKFSNLGDNSPKKLLPSMLRGQALRSLEHVESSRFLESPQDISKVGKLVETSSPAPPNMLTKQDKINSPSNLIVPSVDPLPKKNNLSGAIHVDSSVLKSVTPPPQTKRAFHMSVPEDYLEFDDDSCANGTGSAVSPKGKDILDANPVVDQKTTDSELRAQEKGSTLDGKSKYGSSGGSWFAENNKISASQSMYSSSTTGESTSQSRLVSEKAGQQNKSDSASHSFPLFSSGNGVGSSIEPKASIPISNGDKFTSGEPTCDISKVVSNKSVDSLQVPCTASSLRDSVPVSKGDKVVSFLEPAGLSSTVLSNKNMNASQTAFSTPSITTSAGVSLESKLANISSSSTALALPTDFTAKVPELEKGDGKGNSFSGIFSGSSGATVGTVSAPMSISGPFSLSSTVNKLNPGNGPLPTTSLAFFSSYPPLPTGNVADKHSFGSASDSTAATTITNSSTSNTTSVEVPIFNLSASVSGNSVVNAASSSSSATVSESPFATASFPKFGASPFSTASDKPVFGTSEKSMFATSTNSEKSVFGSLSSTVFGGSSASMGSAGTGVFGFSSASMSSASNQSQSSTFGGHSSVATGFSTFSQSMPSSASSASVGLANGSGSLMFSASTLVSTFNSTPSFAFNTTAASSVANSVSSSSTTTTGMFSSSSWPIKSSYNTSFTSSTPSLFNFGSATAAGAPTSTPSNSLPPPVFSFGGGSSSGGPSTTASSSPLFSFTSASAATSAEPVFNSPDSAFQFGSAPSNNGEMNMEDSMAEDGVQGPTTAVPPVFPQQPVTPIPNFANPFQFGGQQNFSTSQNASPFQPASSIDFSGGGSFSLGSGGGDKSNRRIVKVNRNRQRRK